MFSFHFLSRLMQSLIQTLAQFETLNHHNYLHSITAFYHDWKCSLSDIVLHISAVRLSHYNLQPRSPNAYQLTLNLYNQPSYWPDVLVQNASLHKSPAFAQRHLPRQKSISSPTFLYDFESSGCILPLLGVLKHLTEIPCIYFTTLILKWAIFKNNK